MNPQEMPETASYSVCFCTPLRIFPEFLCNNEPNCVSVFNNCLIEINFFHGLIAASIQLDNILSSQCFSSESCNAYIFIKRKRGLLSYRPKKERKGFLKFLKVSGWEYWMVSDANLIILRDFNKKTLLPD